MQLCLFPCLNSGLISEILKLLGKVDVKMHLLYKNARVGAIVLAANLMYLLGECFGFELARIVIRLVSANYCLRHNFTSSI